MNFQLRIITIAIVPTGCCEMSGLLSCVLGFD